VSTPNETIRQAIDEAVAPLIDDHKTYLAPTGDGSVAVSRAELHYVFDQYHTQLLDFSADMAPVGHSHPFVHDAIKEHMSYYMRTAPVGDHVVRWPVEYARALVDTFTEEDVEPVHQVLFTEGEREALVVAVNLAREKSGRARIALVDTDQHNWYSGINHVDMRLLPLDEFWLKDFRWEDLGALVMSLVTADGKILEPRWVQTVVDEAKRRGVPVIIDESRTGFGRLGTMWGQQAVKVDADITVLGGPVGGGLALGAVVATAENFLASYKGFDIVDVSPQAGSPVACAAGAGVLRAVNPGVLEHVKEASGVFDDALQELVDQFPEYVVASHGVGLLRTVEFQTDIMAREFEISARLHGLLVAAPVGSSLTLTPTLICSEQELKRGVDLMADLLLEWYERDAA
jgi:4-aminobutyrate aminotransferase-like enzyme